MPAGYTYIMGSTSGTLYTGVTSDLYARVHQHKTGALAGFAKQYNCTRLLYSEEFTDIRCAIAREKQIKGWRRERKLDLIRTINPEFKDLALNWGSKMITSHEKIHP
jgi:putative endonuclease